MKKLRKEISDFYKKIFSNSVFKDKIKEKAKKIITEKDLRNLIREEILPLMKKENLNCSEEDLLKYEEETLKNLPKDALADVSGGVSIKSALWAGGILSMALFGSINANAMDVDPFASNPQPTRGSSQQPNNSNNNNNNANQLGDNGDGNHAANNNDRNPAWRSTLYDDLFKKLPQSVQKWASPLIEKGRIVSDGNYLFFFNNKTGSVSPLLPSDVTVLIIPPMVWDVNENVHHVNRVSRFAGIGLSELAKITEFVADPRVTELTIASQCFAYNKNLNNVDLQSVKNLKIEEGAFDGCESLSKFITYPKLKSLTIPRRCFANNKTLKSIDFRSVENLIIEEGAFDGCENLVEFILPENPTSVSIAQNAFVGCSSLDKTLLIEKYGYVESSANINNDNNINEPDDNNNGAAHNTVSQDSNRGNNVTTSDKDNSKDGINNSANSTLPQIRPPANINNNNGTANNPSPQDSDNGYNENTENKNDVSAKRSDDSNNNKSVDEYNDEDYSVDIDEIMASQIREFGKNPEMRTFDRNVAIDMANGKIIFVIPIWCDTIEENSFRVDNLVYPDSPKEKDELALLRKIANSVEILVIPPNVKEIGRWTFSGWPNLKKIIFIDGWPQLHDRSFDQCCQLRKVESIGDSSNRPDVSSSTKYSPFNNCHNLEEIDIANNVIYELSLITNSDSPKYGQKLRKLSMTKQAQIYFCVWYNCYFIPIEELHFPIGSSCKSFQILNWNKLEELDVPLAFDEVSSANEFEIKECDSLKKIHIRGDVKVINKSDDNGKKNNIVCIRSCPKLEEVTFPSSLEYVGYKLNDLIGKCPNLKQITFLSERIYFGKEFFDICDSIYKFTDGCKICLPYAKEIYVGDKKYDIPNDNPDNCIEIVKINHNERDNYSESVRIPGDFVFQKVLDKKEAELILNGSIPGCKYKNENGKIVLGIPDYYSEIGAGAFENNNFISAVVFPYSVKKIGPRAFNACTNINTIFFYGVPEFEEQSFGNCSNVKNITVYVESERSYNFGKIFQVCSKLSIVYKSAEYEDFTFVTYNPIKNLAYKNFKIEIMSTGKIYFEKDFFSSKHFSDGFEIHLPCAEEVYVDCKKTSLKKEENNSKDNSDEEDSKEPKFDEEIPIPEESIGKEIILVKGTLKEENDLTLIPCEFFNKYGWKMYACKNQ